MQIDQSGTLSLFNDAPADPPLRGTAAAALELLEWLRRDALKVEKKWSEDVEGGFRWWPDRSTQTIRITGAKEGQPGDILTIETEVSSNHHLERHGFWWYSHRLDTASLASPVYNPDTGVEALRTQVRTDGTGDAWLRPLVVAAAALQLADVDRWMHSNKWLGYRYDKRTEHPVLGWRKRRNRIALHARWLVRQEREEDRIVMEVMDDLRRVHLGLPPFVTAGRYGTQTSFEVPFGRNDASYGGIQFNQWHPVWREGLFVQQSFPLPNVKEEDGCRMAWELNTEEQPAHPAGFVIGSWAYRDHEMHHVSFMPTMVAAPAMLPTLLHVMVERARRMSVRMTGVDWDERVIAEVGSPEACEARREAEHQATLEYYRRRAERSRRRRAGEPVDDDDDDE